METNITDMVQRYRLALRHIWNCCIWVDPVLRTWESVYSFRALQPALFKALIGDPLEVRRENVFGEGFYVVAEQSRDGDLLRLQVNSRVPSSASEGIWTLLSGPVKAKDFRLILVDFFDWNPLGYLDLRYYVVLIDASVTHPETVGQHALIDVSENVLIVWRGSP